MQDVPRPGDRSTHEYCSPAARALAADLSRAVGGEVRFDRVTRILYSTDASNYQIEPLGVVRPRDADDVAAAVSVCASHGVPIVPRAGGSSLAGQAIGPGVVLDFSAHMRAIEIDPERRTARAEPGVVLDRLNRAAGEHALAFGPDPASADRACLGGVIGNNAAGARSIVHGMAADHLRSAEVVLADGSRTRLAPMDRGSTRARIDGGGLEGALYAALSGILDESRGVIERRFPRYWRRAGGYNLDHLAARAAEDGVIDASILLSGSEGTLAVATALEVGLVPVPPRRALLVAHFDEPLDPFRAVPPLLATEPSAVELVDRVVLELARDAPGYAADVAFVAGDPEALLIVEYSGESEPAVVAAVAAGERALRRAGFGGAVVRAIEPEDQAHVWRARKAGLGLLMRMRGDYKPVPGIEDTAVPPEVLAEYMADVRALLADAGVHGAFYAHASAGCIHVRPILSLKTADGVATLAQLVEETGALAVRYGGVQSSEHGDGLARGALNRRLFGDEVYGLFEEVKAAFDPQGLLNPGKVVDVRPPTANLRYGSGYQAVSIPTRFDYPEDGDFAHAVEQCNGSGVCRKLDDGAMCPSYMVTLDEEHATRGRANVLRAVVDGRLPAEELASDRIWEVMSLCVGCKGCKTECPSGVDMARFKIEVSAARVDTFGASLRSRLFAGLHDLDWRLSPVATLVNLALGGPLARPSARLAGRLLGLAPERRLPLLARQNFDRWWHERLRDGGGWRSGSGRAAVVLFADTISTYHEPRIGRAAVAVLEAAGYRVLVPPRRCCGRPALSQGLVDAAVADMRANVAILAPFARRGLPVLVPEPSCASTFRDEMPDLLTAPGEREDARIVAAAVQTLDEFVAALPSDALALGPGPERALLHVHCHLRALVGTEASVAALERIPGLVVAEPNAGCCGMAGAFGYEAEHYEVSLAMAERKLAPAVRAAPGDTEIVAPGASCRQQIAHTTGRWALHPIELIAACLEEAR